MNSRYLEDRVNARQRRGAQDVVQGWDLIIGDRDTIGDHMRGVKARPLLYTHFNARAGNWTSVLLASSIREHLIGLKALITALNCANARSYPY